MTMTLIWIFILVGAIVLEAATFSLISMWFAFGAAAALIADQTGGELALQLILFIAVSGVMLLVTRPLIKKLFPNKFFTPTNSELDVGKTAMVIEDIEAGGLKGRVRLSGVDWAAVSETGADIPAGALVTVKEVRSAKLIVSPAEEKIPEKV